MFTSSPRKFGKFVVQSELHLNVYNGTCQIYHQRFISITESPVSVAALGLASLTRGLSLRFPRFIKVRDDKSIEEANTPSYLAEMWRSQQGKGKKNQAGNDDGDLIDAEAEISGGWSEFAEEDEG
jgi:DNA ligase-1